MTEWRKRKKEVCLTATGVRHLSRWPDLHLQPLIWSTLMGPSCCSQETLVLGRFPATSLSYFYTLKLHKNIFLIQYSDGIRRSGPSGQGSSHKMGEWLLWCNLMMKWLRWGMRWQLIHGHSLRLQMRTTLCPWWRTTATTAALSWQAPWSPATSRSVINAPQEEESPTPPFSAHRLPASSGRVSSARPPR